MSLIEVQDLNKTFRQAVKAPGLLGAVKHMFTQEYKEKQAVNGINLSIEAGEAVAYVGPNGAGKSTTIKMLSGILVPTSGSVMVDGVVPHKQRTDNARKIGAVFGQRTQLWFDLPIIESFALLKDIYEIPEAVYRFNMSRFTELLSLDEFLHLPTRKLSLGQRMRADLAAALLHDPRIVYLDEPTIGLDIAVKVKIREFIKQINREQGTTIILTTHDLEDIEDICRRLVIIDQGRIIYDGSLQAVKDAFARERTIHFQLSEPLSGNRHTLTDWPGAFVEQREGQHIAIRFDRFEVSASEVVSRVMRLGEVIDFRIDEPKIEQVIRRVYEGELVLTDTEPPKAMVGND
ncbi:ABC transporter ATP-binding protein [Paenibacillus radicis (ex Xue et al. 2023)]|uniref:ATP-binding cassette domain-containing protein n=1 Tax=Paenibacillus radicis (ex Xue et al. 2023) TaxID=2972489 RepID=A0ABT1YL02_9BACL|nr:ATP-binding cassette domain-containing protein [Paenibacillus radicis (ex Xue et al. 2023)]MCR8633089.1 ATP-binding cassette domain-containing protein [Paenibacillus radicis (ex Xue et al. 2023)]